MNTRELLAFLCEDLSYEGVSILTPWITESRRFHAFVVENRAKIRKKLRTARSRESLRSVLLELEVARHFVMDRRCVVEYERYGQGRVRSPDLTVIFRERSLVNLEVTQIQERRVETSDWDGKLVDVVCHKLGQMMPDCFNLLVVARQGASSGGDLSSVGTFIAEDIEVALKRMKEQIECRDGDRLSRFGFADPSSFFKQFQWLSGIAVWERPKRETGQGPGLWNNPQARRPLPKEIASLLTTW
jgi:hypothetical protein